ncbi:hypothetical protein [Flavobacterium terrisoli]|uniref:hypothetical protein n=1 Tax=Flavobacterium terrisoli TaxID=3242195 RepID=UPI002542B9CF|nr:hypothetical protein [Flavobacterium buctense]
MKLKLLKAKFICLFLAVLITLQSCVVYKKNSISIAEAEQTKSKVLVETNSRGEKKFDRIEKKDSIYYGIKVKRKEVSFPLKESDIVSIRPIDKGISTLLTILIIAFPMTIIGIIATQDYSPDFGGSETNR